MSSLETQRNVAIVVAVVALAFVAGYLISNQRPAPVLPEHLAAPTAEVAAASAPVAEPAAVASQPPAAAIAPPVASAPVGGERRPRRVAPAAALDESPASADAIEPAAAADVEPTPAREPERRVERVTIPQSTPIVLMLVAPVSSQSAQVGDEVVAELAEPLRVDGAVVVAAGARVTGRVSEARALRKVGGKALLGLSFDRLDSGDGGVEIAAAFRREGKSETGKDAATIAAGAAIGTILGNQAKSNDRGKLIGAVVGAAAGTAVAAKTAGELVELPAGARLELTLRTDVEVVVDR